jgi:hypothetical protein
LALTFGFAGRTNAPVATWFVPLGSALPVVDGLKFLIVDF